MIKLHELLTILNVPFKLVRNPYNFNQVMPVHEGDDADLIFRNGQPFYRKTYGLGTGPNSGKQWAWNMFSNKEDTTNIDFTITNALKRSEPGDDNKVTNRKSLRNY
jgi:hypothetical protein